LEPVPGVKYLAEMAFPGIQSGVLIVACVVID
jgi:hypothetical protein